MGALVWALWYGRFGMGALVWALLHGRFGMGVLADGLASFNQLHNSLNDGSAGHGGIDDGPPPGPPLDPPFAPEPLLAP